MFQIPRPVLAEVFFGGGCRTKKPHLPVGKCGHEKKNLIISTRRTPVVEECPTKIEAVQYTAAFIP
jgi:hypothetical protein